MWGSLGDEAYEWYVLFDDKVESGNLGWSTKSDTTFSLWHRSTRNPDPNGGGTYNWYCGKDVDSSYNLGVAIHDTLFSPSIDLTGYVNSAYLIFDMAAITDDLNDRATILISTDGGVNWIYLGDVWGTSWSAWDNYWIYIGGYTFSSSWI